MKKIFTIVMIALVGFGAWFLKYRFLPRPDTQTLQNNVYSDSTTEQDVNLEYRVVVENLDIPWEIVFLPDGDYLVTERSGSIVRIGKDRVKTKVDGVKHFGEGGLLGMTLHPEFEKNNYIYLYSTTDSTDGKTTNRVSRYSLDGNKLTEFKVIVDDIPGAIYHDGGRIDFGPDKLLYITTGDATKSSLSQDKNSLAGKILRVSPDGMIPTDNPFGNAVYSYGHRNVQGIAWDEYGRLWATEHGRSGVLTGFDEINLIEKGKNYGWPEIQGDETKSAMESPKSQSGPNTTWAPSGITIVKDKIYFAGLKGESIYTGTITDHQLLSPITRSATAKFGRIRTIKLGPDGLLYILTSNKDGRGKPNLGDDKIITAPPDLF